MAYTPTEWQTGDVIDAEKLNKAEGGIAEVSENGLYIAEFFDGPPMACSKTFAEIVAKYEADTGNGGNLCGLYWGSLGRPEFNTDGDGNVTDVTFVFIATYSGTLTETKITWDGVTDIQIAYYDYTLTPST